MLWLPLTFVGVIGLVFSYDVDKNVEFQDFRPNEAGDADFAIQQSIPRPMNVPILAMGMYCIGFSCIALNAALRRSSGRGPIDWLLARPWLTCGSLVLLAAAVVVRPLAAARVSANLPNPVLVGMVAFSFMAAAVVTHFMLRRHVYAALPVAAAVAALVLLILLWGVDTRIHFDADDAAEAFRTNKVQHVRTTGGFVFGFGLDEKSHVAVASPSLIRALARRAIDLEAAPPRAFPMPGLLPLIASLAIAVYVLVRGRGERRRAVAARSALLFGLLTLYMVWWFTDAARFPMWMGEQGMESAYYVQHVVLAVAGLGFPIFVSGALANERLSDLARAGWGALFFTTLLTLMAGMYLVYCQTPGTPALLWLLLYITLGAIVWWASVPAPRLEEGS